MSDLPEHLPPPDAHFPDTYAAGSGKGELHISGAGTFGMAVLIVSLSILFIASMAAYVLIRWQYEAQAPDHTWPPPWMPHVPQTLWISTLIILAASVTIQWAHNAVRRDDDKALARHLRTTFVLGILFLLAQTANWIEFYMAIRHIVIQGAYIGMFYVLTGLHAAHIIGGLIPLGIIWARAKRGAYSRNFHPGVRYVTVYWHFLDIVWLILFAVLYF